ncbi:helix-turn-helix protein [Mycobacterium marinum]|nr:helix-turn-helix protein [Mycobacterium marinum]
MWTQQETVGLMRRRITAAALSQIEAGKVRPTPDTLRDLADALDVPVDFFYVNWSGARGENVLDRVPYFRDLAATPSRLRRRAGALALILSDLVAAIDTHVRLPDCSIPDFHVAPSAERDEIEETAEALRGEWNLGDDPIPHVVREIERHGIPVARLYLGAKSVDAFSVRFSKRPLILLTDDKSNYVRSRFDAAHELGHLVMHEHADPNDRSIERQAHDFAASFLLPADIAVAELPRRIDSRAWQRLAQLKREWGISINAMLYRARSLGVLTPAAYQNAMKYTSARGWRTLEPGDREMGQPESPRLFEYAIKTIEAEYGMTAEQIIRSAHLPLKDTLILMNLATDRRPTLEF